MKQTLLPETYLFGCGAKQINDKKKTSVFVCSFYPSLLKDRGYDAYKSEEECKKDCKSCTQNSNSESCHTMKCISCQKCDKKATEYKNLCGLKVQFLTFLFD